LPKSSSDGAADAGALAARVAIKFDDAAGAALLVRQQVRSYGSEWAQAAAIFGVVCVRACVFLCALVCARSSAVYKTFS
jgi:hypothetical protein